MTAFAIWRLLAESLVPLCASVAAGVHATEDGQIKGTACGFVRRSICRCASSECHSL